MTPDLPDPDRPIGWGVLAPGRIARSFVEDLAHVGDARLAAVGSRSLARAEDLVRLHATAADPAAPDAARRGREGQEAARAHGSYEELVADPAVDVVYVASPHSAHLEHVRLALGAGKHVLVEKPVALRAADWEEMVGHATEQGLFLMEAMWTACHPVVRGLVTAVRSGRFGAPRHLRAELGFRVEADPGDRLLDPALGAGSLLDMGIYPLTLAHLLLGEAEEVTALADRSTTGIDLDVAVVTRHAGGALATSTASITSWSDRSAALATDRGRVELLGSFHHPDGAVFTPVGRDGSAVAGAAEQVEPEGTLLGRGYGNEAAEVARCLRAGLLESPLVPHAQTRSLMRLLDDVRRQVGVTYDGDLPEA